MMPFLDLNDKIEFCFGDPTVDHTHHLRGSVASVLYLLRRELIETAGYDPNKGDTEQMVDAGGVQRRLFASLILMFTGFDLLAKFQRGDTERVGDRFKAFLKSPDGAGLSPFDAALFWAARNSLVHAFGTLDQRSLAKLKGVVLKGVALGQRKEGTSGGMPDLVTVERHGDYAGIYIDGVFRRLKGSIQRYRDSLHGAGSAPARTA
jgi:hypothetical protein